VLGKNGAMIKLLGEQSRKHLEELLGHKVHLFLHVKVGNWSEDPRHLREIGRETKSAPLGPSSAEQSQH
jgi:GTP-binding protein Era